MFDRDLVLLHTLSTDWALERRSFFHRTFVDWLLFEIPHMTESRSHIKTGTLFFYNNPQLPPCSARTSPWRRPHGAIGSNADWENSEIKGEPLNVEPTALTWPTHRLLISVSHDSLPQIVNIFLYHHISSLYINLTWTYRSIYSVRVCRTWRVVSVVRWIQPGRALPLLWLAAGGLLMCEGAGPVFIFRRQEL